VTIVLNHRMTEYPGERLTVAELLRAMNFTFPLIVIKVNGRLVRREEYAEALVRDGDQVEAIHLISGG